MEKAILSRINLQLQDTHIAQEYFDTISDLIDTQEVQALKNASQHMATSRFQHSLKRFLLLLFNLQKIRS